MIVPFLFTLDEYSKEKPTYMWVMYKYLYFCYINNMPIISMKYYVDNILLAQEKQHSSTTKEAQERYNYKILNEIEYNTINKAIIDDNDLEKIMRKYENENFAWATILKKEDLDLEQIIDEKIEQIEKYCDKKIECFITWASFPSLENIGRKRNIRIVNLELSTIRYGVYREQLGYFCIGNKYSSEDVEKKYNEFKSVDEKYILSRKEILSLLLETNNLEMIKNLYIMPKYDVGIATGLKKDFFESAYSTYSNIEMISLLKKILPDSKISVRTHPAMPYDLSEYNISVDNSNSSAEWISKCKNIVCTISNVGYEAMLYNRGLISVSKNIATSFNKISSLEYLEEDVVGISKLNFLTFYYYVPFDLMFDYDYIKWRLTNPTIEEIYNKNINYLFKKYKINLNKFLKLGADRIDLILDSHNISKSKKEDIKNIGYDYMNNQYLLLEKKYNHLENEHAKAIQINKNNNDEITKLNNYIHNLENSLSWKLTKPIRKISSIIRKK